MNAALFKNTLVFVTEEGISLFLNRKHCQFLSPLFIPLGVGNSGFSTVFAD
jgi:hypothetical protein